MNERASFAACARAFKTTRDLSTVQLESCLAVLSSLNEISGGCEKIAPVSGSFRAT